MSDDQEDSDGELGEPTDWLFDPNIIRLITPGDEFKRRVCEFYIGMAGNFDCLVTLSGRRVREAHHYWRRDRERALKFDAQEGTAELDHFKHAAFIAYWLRRLIPISDVWFASGGDGLANAEVVDEAHPPSEKQLQFVEYGNEICALWAGFYICLSYVMKDRTRNLKEAGDNVVDGTRPGLRVKDLPKQFRSEYPQLLKQKNMSPQALYVLYRSLFDNIEWETERAA